MRRRCAHVDRFVPAVLAGAPGHPPREVRVGARRDRRRQDREGCEVDGEEHPMKSLKQWAKDFLLISHAERLWEEHQKRRFMKELAKLPPPPPRPVPPPPPCPLEVARAKHAAL